MSLGSVQAIQTLYFSGKFSSHGHAPGVQLSTCIFSLLAGMIAFPFFPLLTVCLTLLAVDHFVKRVASVTRGKG